MLAIHSASLLLFSPPRTDFLRLGFWTYEVCPFVSVRQYHSETGGGRGAAVHNENSLGAHQSTLDAYDPKANYYSQHHTGGTDGRSTRVRFLCPDSWRDEDGIVSVQEPHPKQYQINVRVHALCDAGAAAASGSGSSPAAATGSAAAAKAQPDNNGRLSSGTAASRNGAGGRGAGGGSPTTAGGAAAGGATAGGAAAGGAAAGGAAAGGAAAPTGGVGVQIAEMMMPNSRLLSPLRGRCFSVTIDYWTYELCPQQHVRQFRQEGKRVGVEFSLGKYERARDKMTVGVRGGAIPRDLTPHAFAQTYVNGTANRRTEIRVVCAGRNEHALLSVEEPSMHQYVMVFSSPLGCELSCAYATAPPPSAPPPPRAGEELEPDV